MVHRGLMTYDESGAVVPGVAESVDTTDPMSYVFTIRPDLTFHDDTPLTAENVKNSLDYYRDPRTARSSPPASRTSPTSPPTATR